MSDRQPRLYLNIAGFAILLFLVTSMRGCVAITPASFERSTALIVPERLGDDDWPTRHPEPIESLFGRMGQRGDELPQTLFNQVSRLVGYFSYRMQHQTHGRGIVCELPPPDGSRTRQIMYITSRLESEHLAKALEHERPSPEERDKLLRWHFQLKMPSTGTPRGLIVHLTSIGDRRFEHAVSKNLRDRGWAVLHVVPGRIVVPFLHERVAGEGRRVVDAAEVAAVMDEYAADYAFAVEGVLDYLAETEPRLANRPLVLTGYSAGALALPTVAARLDERVNAAVLVGGGANAAGILVDGSITNVISTIRRAGDAHILPDLRAMPDAYLRASRFDPYHTAPYLTGKPVLFIQGTLDQIIPRKYGNLLYERLNRPERWTYPLGHVPLFWILPSQANRIANWIEDSVHH